jgi:iron complex outermembrane receptor protein
MKTRYAVYGWSLAALLLPASPQIYAQGAGLEEVVVTARKRDESIFEIPVSVAAFSQNQLERAGVDNAEELSSFVAGLQFEGSTSTGGRVNPSIRFRGMNQQIITPSTQVGALFWDGSYIGGGGGFLPLADVERVEVIKGPQTAYFGRNTFSGAVNIIPKLPGDEWETNVGVEWSPSQEDEYKFEVGVGGPITDKIGLRVYAGYEKDGGDFSTQDGVPYAVFEDSTISGTLTINPTDKLSLKVSGYYVRADDNGTSVGIDSGQFGVAAGQCNKVYTGEYLNAASGERTPFTRDYSTLPFATFCGVIPDGKNLVAPVTVNPGPGQSFLGDGRLTAMNSLHPLLEKYDILRSPPGQLGARNQTWRMQVGGDYQLAEHTLSFQWSHANTGTIDIRDFFFGVPTVPGTVFIVGNNIALRENYYEARIASSEDRRLRYMLGVSDYRQGYRLANAPVSAAQATGRGPGATIDFQDNTTTAVFASIDYDIQDDLTLSVEARYTDEKSLQFFQGDPGLPCGEFSPVCDAANSYTDFIPRVILNYRPFEGATLYGSYSYSSLLGLPTQAGFVNSVAPQVIPDDQLAALGLFTKPQENTQYEIGWKQQGDVFSFTVAAFFIDWKNQPFAAVILLPTGGTTAYVGPGDSEYKGFDFDFSLRPTDWLDIRGTLAYVDAVMTSFSSRGSNEFSVLGSGPLSVVNDGNEPRNTPPLTASLSPTILGNYKGRDWFVRLDILYHDRTWADYSESLRAPTQTLVNLRAGMDFSDKYRLEIYGKNLTDNKTMGLNGGTTSGPGGNRKIFGEPYQKPEVGLRFTADF